MKDDDQPSLSLVNEWSNDQKMTFVIALLTASSVVLKCFSWNSMKLSQRRVKILTQWTKLLPNFTILVWQIHMKVHRRR